MCVCVCHHICPSSERPVNADQQERTLLKGVFNVRKGKTQLHKWAERQVILCGTCLIVASVKDSLTGKMHILPLVGGKVRGHQGLRGPGAGVERGEHGQEVGGFLSVLSPLLTRGVRASPGREEIQQHSCK